MEGAITTADSKLDGRLKVGISKSKKKSILKGILGKFTGRGGPGPSGYKPVGYGKMNFPKAKATTSVIGSGKKGKTKAFSASLKALLKSKKFSGKLKLGAVKVAKPVKIKRLKSRMMKGILRPNK